MEDDDDFGDLYSDVLLPFQSPPPPPAAAAQSTPQIDLNLSSDDDAEANKPNPNLNLNSSSELFPRAPIEQETPVIRLNLNVKKEERDESDKINPNSSSAPLSRVLETTSVKPEPGSSSMIRLNLNLNVKQEERDESDKNNNSMVEEREDFSKFDIEDPIGDMGSDPLMMAGGSMKQERDDWDSDSDSEDDLRIVLDDDKSHGMMGMTTGLEGDDMDGDPFTMVAVGESSHAPMEEDNMAQGGDGERKDGGDGTKTGMKIGFTNHGYHPYHSQYKYVRPGAAPIPGGAPLGPGGVPGQIRPPVGPVAGRGRGDWRPPGGFNWNNNTAGRGFSNGQEFTLPSHKTIFEVDVEQQVKEKTWRLAGSDVSDFFNFGMNEESWKDYCKQLELLRMGTSMHGKIRVYESGRTEQEYDPDLPPELAAATGIKDTTPENSNAVKVDVGQSDLAKEFGVMRPTLPTGRPIQVETSFVERLPSIDTRPPRLRDSDAIIEIVLEGLENDDPLPEDEPIEQPKQDISREGSVGHQSEENFLEENNEHFDGDARPYNGRKSDDHTKGDDTKPSLLEAGSRCSPNSRGRSSSYPEEDVEVVHEKRRTKSRTRDRSPNITRSGSTLEKREPESKKEGSVDSVGGMRSPRVSSPISGGSGEDIDVHVDDDDLSRVNKERASDTSPPAETFSTEENPPAALKRQRGSSRVQHSSSQDFDDGGEPRAARSFENRKARSGSERDYHKGRPKIPVNMKRSYDDDEHVVKPRGYDERERHEMGKHRLVETSREDPYSYREWDPHGRKERDNPRKRAFVDEIGSRHRNKVHESERMEKDEYFKFKKHMDNGSSRAYYDKDMGSQYRRRDDNTKNRFEAIDDPYRKRRKDDEYMRRDVEKEEMYLGHREYTNHRKRERDDAMDPRKREGQMRSRDEDQYSARYKDEEWVHWERERHKAKQSHEDREILPKRERVDGRDGVRNIGRMKDKELERDYQFKDMGRQSEQLKRRDNKVNDVALLHQKGNEDGYVRGDQLGNDDRRSKQERSSTRSDLENSRTHHKKHKESSRKGKESEGGEHSSIASSKRNQEDRNGQVKETAKGTTDREKGENDISKKHKENATASSDEEHHDSRKGRSKLERWTSHAERDFPITSKKLPSSLSTVLETEKHNPNSEPALSTQNPDENHLSLSDATKETYDSENKNTDPKPVDSNNNSKHLDTVEKLKKRSERFKLPMPSEKEAVVIKKVEIEPSLPMAPDEASPASEIKPERPARKRRW